MCVCVKENGRDREDARVCVCVKEYRIEKER